MSCFGYDLIPVVLQGGIFSTVWNVLASNLIGDLLTDHWLPSVSAFLHLRQHRCFSSIWGPI